jgi:hypothetical protein
MELEGGCEGGFKGSGTLAFAWTLVENQLHISKNGQYMAEIQTEHLLQYVQCTNATINCSTLNMDTLSLWCRVLIWKVKICSRCK